MLSLSSKACSVIRVRLIQHEICYPLFWNDLVRYEAVRFISNKFEYQVPFSVGNEDHLGTEKGPFEEMLPASSRSIISLSSFSISKFFSINETAEAGALTEVKRAFHLPGRGTTWEDWMRRAAGWWTILKTHESKSLRENFYEDGKVEGVLLCMHSGNVG